MPTTNSPVADTAPAGETTASMILLILSQSLTPSPAPMMLPCKSIVPTAWLPMVTFDTYLFGAPKSVCATSIVTIGVEPGCSDAKVTWHDGPDEAAEVQVLAHRPALHGTTLARHACSIRRQLDR